MPLSPGSRLGPFEIVSPLGAGGMGEVYRARDTRLGREVAIKVLPEHLSASPELRARFEREAKTISSLNHPHICTLFDVGREGETDFLVMELIEGETLSARLARGALPTADVLRLGAQIADALDRAHRAGVVHRDLKPGNVMLTKAGAKLMDFGLARATETSGPVSSSGVTMAALTQTQAQSPGASPLTAAGTLVGTFQYMAPEQLEGHEADARADLWALGCVLYEMATGKRAFDGRSQATLISAIISSEPAPVSQAAAFSPPALDRLVGTCLAKDPADRVQSAHDVKLQLQWMADPSSTSSAQPALATSPRSRRGAWPTRAAFAVGVLGLLAAAAAGLALRGHREDTLVLQVPSPSDVLLSGFWSTQQLSPDGQRIAAIANRAKEATAVWLWTLDSPDPAPLSGTEGAWLLAWSPDGRSIAFASGAKNALFRIPLTGGNATRLCDAANARGISWGRKGTILYAPNASGPLFRIAADGGTPAAATALDTAHGETAHRWPCFLPDGEHFLFAALPSGPRGYPIYVGSLGSTKATHIMDAECAPTYVEPGYLIFADNGHATAQRFDLRSRKPVGTRIPIGELPMTAELAGEPLATGSSNGRLLVPQITAPHSRLTWVDRRGATLSAIALPDGDWVARSLAPDQQTAVASRDGDIWQVDLGRAVATRIARNAPLDFTSAWSPDGRRIALTPPGTSGLVRLLNAGGSGAQDSLRTVPSLFQEVVDWSPDGRTLLVSVIQPSKPGAIDNSWDLWTVPADGHGAAQPYAATPASERVAAISPDGRWLLFGATTDNQLEVFVDSYPVPGHRVQILSAEADRSILLAWGRGGREVFYSDKDGNWVSVPLTAAGDGLRVGEPSTLFRLSGARSVVTRDGERFLVSVPSGDQQGASMRLILHWTGLLPR